MRPGQSDSNPMFEYDVAISFAGEQRDEAEAIADCLRDSGIKVFYDKYETANLWGKDLYEHLSDVYQNKARYCLMLVSAAYADKVWTTLERRNAQARALIQKGEYILPVRFDETAIPGLPDTVAYLAFDENGVQRISALLIQKLGSPVELSVSLPGMKGPSAPQSNEFWEQRRKLVHTEIARKILSKPHWRIWIRPTEFKKARFRNLEHCREFMNAAYVRVSGWFPYPWFSPQSIHTDEQWISSEIDKSDPGRVNHTEHWVLFRSAQFIHYRAFDEIPQLGDRVHVLEILDTASAAFEFAARMAKQNVLSPEAVVAFELHGLDGRLLTWPRDPLGSVDAVRRDCWCQDESFAVTKQANVAEFETRRRNFALETAFEIYQKFGWLDPPRDILADEQRKRFGDV